MKSLEYIVFVLISFGIFKNNLGDCPPICSIGSTNSTITVLATDITDDITDEVDNADENSY